MNKILFILCCLSINPIISQESAIPKTRHPKIEILKSKKVSKTLNARAHTIIRDKNAKRVMVRCKINPLDGQIDINAFSLVDTKNKIRYRLSDVTAYYAFGGPKINRYWKEKPINKKGKEIEVSFAEYNPLIRDTFLDYNFSDYKISETKFPFSSGQNISNYYGKVESKRKFTADFYFVLERDLLDEASYALYFGNEMLGSVDF